MNEKIARLLARHHSFAAWFPVALWGTALATNAWLILLASGPAPTRVAGENGALENLQALFVAFALLLFASRIRSCRPAIEALSVGLGFVAFAFLFREVDLRDVGVPDWVVLLTSGIVRDGIFFTLLGLLVAYLIRRWRAWGTMARFAFGRRALPLYLCLVLLIVAATIDKGLLPLPHPLFWEEAIEVDAYLALVFGAWSFRRWAPG